MNPRAHHPQDEATALLPAGHVARVLEPSPPAVNTEPWFADDPAAVGDEQLTVVAPTSAGDVTWAQLAAQDEAVAEFAAQRWLAPLRPLGPVPDSYPDRRDDLQRLGFAVVSNARKAANSKFGLRYTCCGFGTPFFGDDVQVRVQGAQLVIQRGAQVQSQPVTTLAAAAEFCGVQADGAQREHDTVELGDLDRPLAVDEELVEFVSDWFGFATAVLEELRCTPAAMDPSRVQLWPGHFDIAMEVGANDPERSLRATYGASPGDAAHPEPYLYVGPWGGVHADDPYWNAESFGGAELAYANLRVAASPHDTALDFFRTGYQRIHSA